MFEEDLEAISKKFLNPIRQRRTSLQPLLKLRLDKSLDKLGTGFVGGKSNSLACAELVEVLATTKPLGVGGILGPNPFLRWLLEQCFDKKEENHCTIG